MSKALGVYKIIFDETDDGDTRAVVLVRGVRGYDEVTSIIVGEDANYILEKLIGGTDV